MTDKDMIIGWWILLSCIAVLNIGLLTWAFIRLKQKKTKWSAEFFSYRKLQFILTSIYVAGCAFRSFFPRGDVQRVVLFDSFISSVAIGRTVATIAELAFVAQWALLLREMARYTGDKRLNWFAWPIVPLIVLAEVCSWYGVLTTNYIGNTIEESLWTLTAAIAVAGFIMARPRYEKAQQMYLNAAIGLGVMFVIYMVTVDVPSYFRSYLASEAAGREYLTVAQGWAEVTSKYTHTFAMEYWRYAMVWMTGYFSMAVWVSIFMVNAPAMNQGLKVEDVPAGAQRA